MIASTPSNLSSEARKVCFETERNLRETEATKFASVFFARGIQLNLLSLRTNRSTDSPACQYGSYNSYYRRRVLDPSGERQTRRSFIYF